MKTLQIEILNPAVLNVLQTLADKNEIRFIDTIAEFKEKYKDLPITWATQTPNITDITAVLESRKLSINELRENAWKRN